MERSDEARDAAPSAISPPPDFQRILVFLLGCAVQNLEFLKLWRPLLERLLRPF
jgi:hypothetical protein